MAITSAERKEEGRDTEGTEERGTEDTEEEVSTG